MIKENSAQAIVINSVILYLRLFVTAVCGLFTTRYALEALGVNDYGLFAVVGGIISFIAILNTIMLSTSNRFIATAIGKKDLSLISKTFNVNLIIHLFIAVFTVCVLGPIGKWYIENYINYSGNTKIVLDVYYISLFCSAISFIGVPYNGLLLAKERFVVFCSTDIFASVIKLVISYILISHFEAKLLIYAFTLGITTAFPTLIFYLYCRHRFPLYVKFKFIKDRKLYKEIFNFSIWVGYGALASIGKSQGGALIINRFFNTVMNTAYGIANTVNGILLTFAHNVTKSIAPQITKSYAAGEYSKSEKLVIISSKVSFSLMLLISSPFIVTPELIFSIWLGEIPDYVIIFTYLVIADALIGALNAGIPELIFASGKIKSYQIIVNTVFLLSIVAGYFTLKAGFPAYYLQIVYILFSFLALIIRQIVLNKVVKFNNKKLFIESYLPSVIVFILFLGIFFLKPVIDAWLLFTIALIYLLVLIFLIGLNKDERGFIIRILKLNRIK